MVSGSAVSNANPSMKGETLMHKLTILVALLSLSLSSPARADNNPMPPVPEGGLMLMMEGGCTDKVTQERGYCVMSQDRQGNVYVMFAVDGELVEIRQVIGSGYVTLWRATPGVPA